ncbi:MAG: hypothetical protein PHG74_05230, partial [Kiritimatiellae bacterium]|nr:hypothetical protein [Kiritimatiellia bacterium]
TADNRTLDFSDVAGLSNIKPPAFHTNRRFKSSGVIGWRQGACEFSAWFAPDSLLSFSPETRDLRTSLSLAYNLSVKS